MVYLIIAALVITSSFFIFSLKLKTTFYNIESEKINSKIRIVQLSDLHCDRYGKNQEKLKTEIEKLTPDIIVFTGDIHNYKGKDVDAIELLRWAGENYTCFYVTGNHEFRRKESEEIKNTVKAYNLTVLDGKVETVEIKGNTINICGVDDRDSSRLLKTDGYFENQVNAVKSELNRENFSVFLCHQPQITDVHKDVDPDLVLSGHAHGGQWKLPWTQNGLFYPDEGLFPKYSGGLFEFEDYTLIVSRGLAKTNTIVPRIFNRPEITVIDLE
jgi:predicted MPP superfamily phosphohydrolase